MRPRLNYAKVAPGVYNAMDALDQYSRPAASRRGISAKRSCVT